MVLVPAHVSDAGCGLSKDNNEEGVATIRWGRAKQPSRMLSCAKQSNSNSGDLPIFSRECRPRRDPEIPSCLVSSLDLLLMIVLIARFCARSLPCHFGKRDRRAMLTCDPAPESGVDCRLERQRAQGHCVCSRLLGYDSPPRAAEQQPHGGTRLRCHESERHDPSNCARTPMICLGLSARALSPFQV